MDEEQHPALDALERLASLYEKGLLTREEFDAQKAAVLAGRADTGSGDAPIEPPPAAPTEATVGAPPAGETPVVLIVSAVVAVVAVGAVLAVLWSRSPPTPPGSSAATAAMTAASPAATPAVPPPTLDQAFALAFGGKGSAVQTFTWQHYPIQVRYTPQKLIPITGGYAVIAKGDVVQAAHVNSGFLGIAYLAPGPGGWMPAGQWPQFVETGSFGEIDKWKPRDDLFDNPGIEVDGGGEWQGCAVDYADLVELTPGKPTLRAGSVLIRFSYVNPGADDAGDAASAADPSSSPAYGDTTGKIVADVKGQSFKVFYDSDFARTVTYTRGPVVFTATANRKSLPSC
ncbi:MAG TPA: SHOCT domain-containing protein [Caulobacteraceae bacterium]